MSRIVTTVLMLGLLLGSSVMLSACNTTAGAGQDVSAVGRAVTNGANDLRR